MAFTKQTASLAGSKSKRKKSKFTLLYRKKLRTIMLNNIENINDWIIRVAEEDPERALYFIEKFASYSIPKKRKK